MIRTIALSALLGCAAAPASVAEPLAVTSFATNDFFGDGKDRWRTGSRQLSVFSSDGISPHGHLEFSLHAEVVAPDHLDKLVPNDRPYAGILSLTAARSFAISPQVEARIGGGIDMVGPQTGLDDLHDAFHEMIDNPPIHADLPMVGDDLFLNASIEVATRMGSPSRFLRPYAGIHTGAETLARVGADYVIAQHDALALVREAVTGAVAPVRGEGITFVAGADVTRVAKTHLLDGVTQEDVRLRARIGLQFASENLSVFVGHGYLSPEFEEQGSGQANGVFGWSYSF